MSVDVGQEGIDIGDGIGMACYSRSNQVSIQGMLMIGCFNGQHCTLIYRQFSMFGMTLVNVSHVVHKFFFFFFYFFIFFLFFYFFFFIAPQNIQHT